MSDESDESDEFSAIAPGEEWTMYCPVCEADVAWRGTGTVEDGDLFDCLECKAPLQVRVDTSVEIEGADGLARLRPIP